MANESDPTLVLDPVVYVRTDLLNLERVPGRVLAFVAGGMFGFTIVYQWIVRREYELFTEDHSLTMKLLLLATGVSIMIGFLFVRLYCCYLKMEFGKLRRRISNATLGGEAILCCANGRTLKRSMTFDTVRWSGPPLICADYEPSGEIQKIHPTEEVDLFGGARRFDSTQPFPILTLMVALMAVLGFLPVVFGFAGRAGVKVLLAVTFVTVGALVALWIGRASTFHVVAPVSLSSCMVAVGSVQITRLGRTSVFTREDSVVLVEPERAGGRVEDPRTVRVAIVLVRSDGRTRRMSFRGEANPCIADLIGRWMYGYELPEQLARRTQSTE